MKPIRIRPKKVVTMVNNAAAGWRTVGHRECYFRSRAEYRYALYLQYLQDQAQIKTWEHEHETFYFEEIKRGTRSYLPDFAIWPVEGDRYFAEVKGWMNPKSATKLKRMAKYYPHIQINLIDAGWFRRNAPLLKKVLKGWDE